MEGEAALVKAVIPSRHAQKPVPKVETCTQSNQNLRIL